MIYKLKDLGELRNGANYPSDSYGRGFPIVNVKDLFTRRYVDTSDLSELREDSLKHPEEYYVEENDILFSRSSLVQSGAGMCAIAHNVPKHSIFCGFIIRFRIKRTDVVNPLYLLYLLRSPSYRKLFTGTQQTSIANINQETLGNIEVDLPSLSKQNKVVECLDAIDSKIECNLCIFDELQKTINLIYEYWFLQFNFPDKDNKPYVSNGGALVFNDRVKQEIPAKWSVGTIMNNPLTSDIKPGVDYFKQKKYLPTANINGEIIDEGDEITFENRESRANMQPTLLSVWFAKMKNSIKHLSIPSSGSWFVDKYILSTGFQGLQCSEFSFSYIHSVVNSSWFERYKDTLAHGATQESVNSKDMNSICFVIPDEKTLRMYSSICDDFIKRKFDIIQENQELSVLHERIMPLLLFGAAI